MTEPPASRLPGAHRRGRVLYMESFRRTVADLDRAIDFYCDALGFELDLVGARDVRGDRCAVLTLGSEAVELVARDGDRATAPSREVRSSSLGFQHIAIVATDLPAAFVRLEKFSPGRISARGPVLLPASTGSVTAFKCQDPDGHPLELIHFPEGVGDPRWHRSAVQGPTVGIDHSAIVVGDAERSVAFYRDLLGFSVGSRQVNRGPEQDALDGASGVVVDVVALRAAASPTPHLELLGYRHPVPTAEAAGLSRAGAADQIVWAVSGLADIAARLDPAWPRLSEATRASRESGALVFDPDGHAHRLIERGE